MDDNVTENWLDKYKPQKSSDIIGDKYYVTAIKGFLDQFVGKKIIKKPNLLIIGKNGIGKTLTVDLLLKENSFEKITINLSNVITKKKTKKKSQQDLPTGPNKITTLKTPTGSSRSVDIIYSSIADNRKTVIETENSVSSIKYIKFKSVLIFDDVSTISNPKEKEAIKALVKMNNKHKRFPIIIISNVKHNKLVNEIRKIITYDTIDKKNTSTKKSQVSNGKKVPKEPNEIKMKAPDFSKLEEFIKYICKKENLKIISRHDDDEDIYSEIVLHSQYDVRCLIYCLEELKFLHGNSAITLENFMQYKQSSKMKDIDHNIYEATELLLNKYSGINDTMILYSEERATIPLMVHENYLLNIRLNYPSLSALNQINIICDISTNISESDKIDGLIYSTQWWGGQPLHCYFALTKVSWIINKMPDKLSIKEIDMYRYTQDYTKTSTRQINNKVIRKSRENIHFKKMMTNDFLHMTNIIKNLINKNNYEEVIEIMLAHNLSLKDLESIINIDRISPKFVINNKIKKLIKDKLE
jgi:hypothetical protein